MRMRIEKVDNFFDSPLSITPQLVILGELQAIISIKYTQDWYHYQSWVYIYTRLMHNIPFTREIR